MNLQRWPGNPKYVWIKQQSSEICEEKLIEQVGETDKYYVIVKDFNTYFSTVDRITRYKISNVTEGLNTTLGQDLISIYRALSWITAEYIFLKAYMKHLPR